MSFCDESASACLGFGLVLSTLFVHLTPSSLPPSSLPTPSLPSLVAGTRAAIVLMSPSDSRGGHVLMGLQLYRLELLKGRDDEWRR